MWWRRVALARSRELLPEVADPGGGSIESRGLQHAAVEPGYAAMANASLALDDVLPGQRIDRQGADHQLVDGAMRLELL